MLREGHQRGETKVMDQRVDTPEQVHKFAPKEKAHANSCRSRREKPLSRKSNEQPTSRMKTVIAPCPWHINFRWNSERPKIEHIN
jgi:hypothetical protein